MARRRLNKLDREIVLIRGRFTCCFCHRPIPRGDTTWQVSHTVPLALGGKDIPQNREPAHADCHQRHTAAIDVPAIADMKRQRDWHTGRKGPGRGRHPMPCGRRSPLRKTMGGKVVPRLTLGQQLRASGILPADDLPEPQA